MNKKLVQKIAEKVTEWEAQVTEDHGTFYICVPKLLAQAASMKKGDTLYLRLLDMQSKETESVKSSSEEPNPDLRAGSYTWSNKPNSLHLAFKKQQLYNNSSQSLSSNNSQKKSVQKRGVSDATGGLNQ